MDNNWRANRGFTLIELLVVIAIIGILSAVVLASLSAARNKGNDAAVKSDLHGVETQAGIFFADNNNFGTFDDGSGNPTTCPTPGTVDASLFGDNTVEAAIDGALTNSGGGSTFCVSDGPSYAVALTRPPGSTSIFWCLDSAGTKCGNDGDAGNGVTPIVGTACVLPCTAAQ